MCNTWSFTKLALWFTQQQICIKCLMLAIVPGTEITDMGTMWLLTQKSLAQGQTPNKWRFQWGAKYPSRLHEGLRSAGGEHLLCHWGSEGAGWPHWETLGWTGVCQVEFDKHWYSRCSQQPYKAGVTILTATLCRCQCSHCTMKKWGV